MILQTSGVQVDAQHIYNNASTARIAMNLFKGTDGRRQVLEFATRPGREAEPSQ